MGFYEDYYSIHLSEKIRITFFTTITAIFFQLIYLSYYSINLNIFIIKSWILIPIIILSVRYFLKINNKSINNITISIIGNIYKFKDHEIKILRNKKFSVKFYDGLNQYLDRVDVKSEKSNIVVINTDSTMFQNNEALSSLNTISLCQFMENYLRKVCIDDKSACNDINKYNKSDILFKRIIDYIAVIILFPILILLSIYVISMNFLKSYNGSFIFLQKRHGEDQGIFSVYKLRTMYVDSDIQGNTTKSDERVYPYARVLRKLRLDELPQILNILLGHMHLVGPRAEWIELSNLYSTEIDNYKLRNVVRPGITGWAQVLYQYGFDINDSKQKLMFDLYYIKNWTIWLELEICIKTIIVILDKKGF
tara:strand:+ start:239 stop:1333 length:1095 start_codon:yes stop_codon:yes gene_type:complete